MMMIFLKKYQFLIFEAIFFITLFVLSIVTVRDFDVWFHIRSGEIISEAGIIHKDVFSYNTLGREWFPYEWLFQIVIYNFLKIFGFEQIKFLVAIFATIQAGALYLFLRYFFNLNRLFSFITIFFFFVSIHEFFSPRPYLFAYTCLIINLYLILLYYFKNKNYLFLTIPITLFWANLHGSIFLSIALFAGYSVVCLINLFLSKNRLFLKKFRVLALFTLITSILTILPPLYFLQYKLLFIFYKERSLISSFISEWSPLVVDAWGVVSFSTAVVLVSLIYLFTVYKKKVLRESLWLLPLLPFPIASYFASRNVFLGYVSLSLILGWCLSKFDPFKLKLNGKIILGILLIIFIVANIYILVDKRKSEETQQLYYPVMAAQFIKNEHLKGHMFNEYGYGGFLLYYLYPEQKVFIDGRTDLYLCCEMREILDLSYKKNLGDDQYKNTMDQLWQKHDISFVLLRTQKHTVLRKITRILQDDPNWSLVFWDDVSQIFIRHDEKNDDILEKFGTQASTPYNKDPFRQGLEDQALKEYQRMIEVADSSKSRNAIGFIYLKDKKYDQARQEFEKAIKLNPLNESPYMNLAELKALDGNILEAIKLYTQAKDLAPDRGLIYIRLGQLMLSNGENISEVKKIWQEGVKNTVDDDAKKKLQELINKL